MDAAFNGIEYHIGKNALTIKDSYKIDDDSIKRDFIDRICEANPNIEKSRSRKSLLLEWKAHNILYKFKLFPSRTKDTDLEYKQTQLMAFGYRVICALFREWWLYNLE